LNSQRDTVPIPVQVRLTPRQGLFLVGLGSVFFGFTGVISKTLYAQTDITPVGVSWLRMLVAALPMLAVVGTRARDLPLRPRSARDLALMLGVGLAVGGYQITFFSGVERSTVTTVTLIAICTAPIMVALLAGLLLGERLDRKMGVALACALAGTALMVQSGGQISLSVAHLSGNLLALGAAASYAGFVLISKSMLDRLDSLAVLALAFCVASLWLAPFAMGDVLGAGLSWRHSPYILGLGLGSTALAYGLLTTGLNYASATAVSIATLIEPLTATIAAAALFQERLGALGLAGAALLLVGMLILYRQEP
jgi:drug/metabolite transporter, DME family